MEVVRLALGVVCGETAAHEDADSAAAYAGGPGVGTDGA